LKILTDVHPNGTIGKFYRPICDRENNIGALNSTGLNRYLMVSHCFGQIKWRANYALFDIS
jgi:hypothetical protein